MFVIKATYVSPLDGKVFEDFMAPNIIPGQPGYCWGSRPSAVEFPTLEAAAKAYKANRPRAQFRAGRVFDVVPA